MPASEPASIAASLKYSAAKPNGLSARICYTLNDRLRVRPAMTGYSRNDETISLQYNKPLILF